MVLIDHGRARVGVRGYYVTYLHAWVLDAGSFDQDADKQLISGFS